MKQVLVTPHRLNKVSGLLFLGLLLTGLASCTTIEQLFKEEPEVEEPRDLYEELRSLPEIPREFRAVWIASVANIDWPSEPGLSAGEQKSELRSLFDKVAMLNMNAIILQVRPAADALYKSDMEPWSEYLTGEMGKAPQPEYDPLEFAIEEAHRRGMELHAWLNPFRALHASSDSLITENHIAKKHPEFVVEYGGQLWMDPGFEEVRQYNIDIAVDILERYNVDGIHLDDYFYPYRVADEEGEQLEFPDSLSWQLKIEDTDKDSLPDRDEWRRQNVNSYVRNMYQAIRERDDLAQFGISPFGIWRPGHPEQVEGMDAYEDIFADSRKWLREGWVDYFTPQLYWPIDQYKQSYTALLEWWNSENPKGRHLWPGNFISRVGLTPANLWEAPEIIDQIRATRDRHPSDGNIHFSMQALTQEDGTLSRLLAEQVYREPALIPTTPWLENQQPMRPRISVDSYMGRNVLSMQSRDEHNRLWAIRLKKDENWEFMTLPGWKQHYVLNDENVDIIVVNAVSRSSQTSPNAVINLNQIESQ